MLPLVAFVVGVVGACLALLRAGLFLVVGTVSERAWGRYPEPVAFEALLILVGAALGLVGAWRVKVAPWERWGGGLLLAGGAFAGVLFTAPGFAMLVLLVAGVLALVAREGA